MGVQATLGLTGDVMLSRKVDARHRTGTPEAVWGDVLPDLRALDGCVINLECCVSTRGERWTTTHRPFHFRASPHWAIEALSTAGIDCCSLANNHILDFGERALRDTIDHLNSANIETVGAGETLTDALRPAVFTTSGLRVAVIAFTDNTPEYAAGERSPGTARVAFDVEDDTSLEPVTRSLRQATEQDPDLLIASLHWGPNMVETPREEFREFARWLADREVDLIHGHSAHILQGVEVIGDVPVLYDLGDFVDDYAVDPAKRNDRSVLVEATCTTSGEITELRFRPTEITDCHVDFATESAGIWIRDRIEELSGPFGTAFDRRGDDLVLRLQ